MNLERNVAMKKVVDIPDWVPDDIFKEYLEMRKEKGCKLTPTSFTRFFKKLKQLSLESNCSPEAILDQSITNGWRGIFPLHSDTQVKILSAAEKACIIDN
jgi:hypothetical protein